MRRTRSRGRVFAAALSCLVTLASCQRGEARADTLSSAEQRLAGGVGPSSPASLAASPYVRRVQETPVHPDSGPPRVARVGDAKIAELPRASVEIAYPAGGRRVRVAAGADLQAAIDAARPGDVLLLAPNATYVGEFVLRDKGPIPASAPARGWIVIRTDVPDAALGAAGTRMTPTRARSLALAKVLTPTNQPAIATARGSRGWRLTGIEVSSTGGRDVYSLVDFGSADWQVQRTMQSVPTNLILDRSYVHGTPTLNLRRCVNLNSANSAVVDSWLGECHSRGGDSQAILGLNGPGPFLIQNNYLESGHQAFMFGGGDPAIRGLVPSDITLRGNHMSRPPSWKGSNPYPAGTWQTKTIVETKNARRLLLEGNVIENVWADAQVGYALLFKSVNQDGGCPQCTTQDVTIRYNRIRNVAAVFNLAARPEEHPVVPASRFTIHDNVVDAVNVGRFTGPGDAFQILGDVSDVIVTHNTILNPTGRSTIMFDGGPNTRFVMHSNVLTNGQYGVFGSGRGGGNGALVAFAPNGVFARNVLVGGQCGAYPLGTSCPARLTEVGFRNVFGGDYRLTAESGYRGRGWDGRDIGADVDRMEAATRNVVVAP